MNRFYQTLIHPNPTEADLQAVWDALGVAGDLALFAELRRHIFALIDASRDLMFTEAFGFGPFALTDILDFLFTESVFEFSLNRRKQAHVLYGLAHAKLRRSLLNGLPKPVRRAVMFQKCAHFGLFKKIADYLVDSGVIPDPSLFQVDWVTDLTDVGMGHSVYRVSLAVGEVQTDIIVKRENLVNQTFFCELLPQLGLPSFFAKHVHDAQGQMWELTECLGDCLLTSLIDEQGLLPGVLEQLANHAALGDVFGRGDRHGENYMVRNDQILPIDISFLFADDNEFWTEKYIQGGVYEFSCIPFGSFETVLAQMTTFFRGYDAFFAKLQSQQSHLITAINAFYGNNSHTHHKRAFLKERLVASFPIEQRRRYIRAWGELCERRFYKAALKTLASLWPDSVWQEPWLKMYYLADDQRPSAFFLIEDQQEPIFEKIRAQMTLYGLDITALDAQLAEAKVLTQALQDALSA
ncbi:MAG: hypothetical protein AB7F28_02670 [Candidatus Margulisiibacteriota bacterium]